MNRSHLGLFVVLLSLSIGAAAEAPSVPTVAVMPFTGRSLDTNALEAITSALGSDLLNAGKFRVMERSQMDAILKEQSFQQSGACDGAECAVEVGKLLAVDHMVVGTVGKVGELYVVTTKLVKVQTGEVLQSVTRTSQACIEAIVTDILPQLAHELSGIQDASPIKSTTACSHHSPGDSIVPAGAPVASSSGGSTHWGWWVAGGAVVAGGATAAVLLLSSKSSGSNSGSSSSSSSSPMLQVVEP